MQKNLQCPKHKKKVVLVCCQEKCSSNRLCCVHCVEQHCKGHLIQSIGKFHKEMKEKLHKNNTNPLKGIIKQILIEFHHRTFENFGTMRQIVNNYLQTCESKVNKTFQNMYNSLSRCSYQDFLSHLYSPMEENLSDEQIINSISKNIGQALKAIQSEQDMYFGNIEQVQGMIDLYEDRLQDHMEQMLDDLVGAFSPLIKFSDKIKPFSKAEEVSNEFSKAMRNYTLQLSDSSRGLINKSDSFNYPVAFTKYPLDQVNNSVKFLIERIDESTNISFGVGIPDIVKKHGYMNCKGYGKGCYAIQLTQGQQQQDQMELCLWNHHIEYLNSQSPASITVNFTLKEGDEIKVCVDYSTKIVEFSKGEASFEMPIHPENGPLYGFAGLGSKTGCISIID